MYQHLTKLILAGVVAVALLALGITSMLSPASAAKPGKLPPSCGVDNVAKWSGAEWVCAFDFDAVGGLNCGSGQVAKFTGGAWECAADEFEPDTDTLGGLNCGSGQVAKFNGGAWECADVSDPAAGPKTVFVTSGTFTGDLKTQGGALTGLRGADEICQAAAEQGIVPPGIYIAWLSTSAKDAKDRLPDTATEYLLPSGIKVADGLVDLLSCEGGVCLDHEINEDATATPVPLTNEVWTGSTAGGVSGGADCAGWTSASSAATGESGNSSSLLETWAETFSSDFCDAPLSLYCFQR